MSSGNTAYPGQDKNGGYTALPMTDQDEAKLCNSSKNHLGYDDDEAPPEDVEAGNAAEGEEAEGEGAPDVDDDEAAALSAKDKIPAIYQVDPGCTPLSCYSAIITSIIMCIGILWLLLISDPFNVNTRYGPWPILANETLDLADTVPDNLVYKATTEGPSTTGSSVIINAITETILNVTAAAVVSEDVVEEVSESTIST